MDFITFHSLFRDFTAPLQKETAKERLNYGNPDWVLYSASIFKKNDCLELWVKFDPTFEGPEHKPLDKAAPKWNPKKKDQYSLFVKIYQISKVLDFNQPLKEQVNDSTVWSILDVCPIKLFMDDPSFYWQGMWKDADDRGIALFKMPANLKALDKGVWHSRTPNLRMRVTKHIAQLSQESFEAKDRSGRIRLESFANKVARTLLLPNKIKEGLSRSNLRDLKYHHFVEDLTNNPIYKRLREATLADILKNDHTVVQKIKKADKEESGTFEEKFQQVLDTEVPSELEESLKSILTKVSIQKLDGTKTTSAQILQQRFKVKAPRAMNIFSSEYFQALLDSLGFKQDAEEIQKQMTAKGVTYWETCCLFLTYLTTVNYTSDKNDQQSNVYYDLSKTDSSKLPWVAEIIGDIFKASEASLTGDSKGGIVTESAIASKIVKYLTTQQSVKGVSLNWHDFIEKNADIIGDNLWVYLNLGSIEQLQQLKKKNPQFIIDKRAVKNLGEVEKLLGFESQGSSMGDLKALPNSPFITEFISRLITTTGNGRGSRNVTGRGEFVATVLFGGKKASSGNVDISTRFPINKNQSIEAKIEVKYGQARLDGPQSKAKALTDNEWREMFKEALRTIVDNPNEIKDIMQFLTLDPLQKLAIVETFVNSGKDKNSEETDFLGKEKKAIQGDLGKGETLKDNTRKRGRRKKESLVNRYLRHLLEGNDEDILQVDEGIGEDDDFDFSSFADENDTTPIEEEKTKEPQSVVSEEKTNPNVQILREYYSNNPLPPYPWNMAKVFGEKSDIKQKKTAKGLTPSKINFYEFNKVNFQTVYPWINCICYASDFGPSKTSLTDGNKKLYEAFIAQVYKQEGLTPPEEKTPLKIKHLKESTNENSQAMIKKYISDALAYRKSYSTSTSVQIFWMWLLKKIYYTRYNGANSFFQSGTPMDKALQSFVNKASVLPSDSESYAKELVQEVVKLDFTSYAYISVFDGTQVKSSNPNFDFILFVGPLSNVIPESMSEEEREILGVGKDTKIKSENGFLLIPTQRGVQRITQLKNKEGDLAKRNKITQTTENSDKFLDNALQKQDLTGESFSKDSRAANAKVGINSSQAASKVHRQI